MSCLWDDIASSLEVQTQDRFSDRTDHVRKLLEDLSPGSLSTPLLTLIIAPQGEQLRSAWLRSLETGWVSGSNSVSLALLVSDRHVVRLQVPQDCQHVGLVISQSFLSLLLTTASMTQTGRNCAARLQEMCAGWHGRKEVRLVIVVDGLDRFSPLSERARGLRFIVGVLARSFPRCSLPSLRLCSCVGFGMDSTVDRLQLVKFAHLLSPQTAETVFLQELVPVEIVRAMPAAAGAESDAVDSRVRSKTFQDMNRVFRSLPSEDMQKWIAASPQYFAAYHDEFRTRRSFWSVDPALAIPSYLLQQELFAGAAPDKNANRVVLRMLDLGCGLDVPLLLRLAKLWSLLPPAERPVLQFVGVDYRIDSPRVYASLADGVLPLSLSSDDLPSLLLLEGDAASTADVVARCRGLFGFPTTGVLTVVFCLAMSGQNIGQYLRTALHAGKASGCSLRIIVAEAAFRFGGASRVPVVLSLFESFLRSCCGELAADMLSVREIGGQVLLSHGRDVSHPLPVYPKPEFIYFEISLEAAALADLAETSSSRWNRVANDFFLSFPKGALPF